MFTKVCRDFSISATIAGLIALMATYSGPVLILVQAAHAGNLSHDLLSTWIWSVSMGAGVLGLWLSVRHRVPVIGAWSTPGVALLISGLTQYSFEEVVGCYVVVAVLVAFLGVSGLFTKLMEHLPSNLLSAMIAGVLFEFCTKIFLSLQATPVVVFPVVIAYVFCRRVIPRYAVALALLVGVATALTVAGPLSKTLDLSLVKPIWTRPTFSIGALIGLGLPLFLLALTQYATSIHILRNAKYEISPRSVVGASGIFSIPLTFFGNSGINPAAIVGAMCASQECHEDSDRRYISGIVCGLGYLCIGTFGASIIALFAYLPGQLTATLAGLALLGTLVSSLSISMSDEKTRESSLITFIVTVSGMSFFGLGSALWGFIAGLIFLLVTSKREKTNPISTADLRSEKRN